MSEPFIREASASSIDYPQVLPAATSSADYLFLFLRFAAPLLLSTKPAYRAPRSAGQWQLQQHFLPLFFHLLHFLRKTQKAAFSILLHEVTFVPKNGFLKANHDSCWLMIWTSSIQSSANQYGWKIYPMFGGVNNVQAARVD